MTKRVDKYPIVYVEWEDSEHDGAWSEVADEENYQLGQCYSVGWLVHENEKRIVLACAFSQTEVGNKQYIPVQLITKRVVLKEGKKDGVRRKRSSVVVTSAVSQVGGKKLTEPDVQGHQSEGRSRHKESAVVNNPDAVPVRTGERDAGGRA